MPNPPLLDLFFLICSLTAMFAVPVSMNVYWLIGGVAASVMNKAIKKHEKAPQIIQPEIATQPGNESAPTEG